MNLYSATQIGLLAALLTACTADTSRDTSGVVPQRGSTKPDAQEGAASLDAIPLATLEARFALKHAPPTNSQFSSFYHGPAELEGYATNAAFEMVNRMNGAFHAFTNASGALEKITPANCICFIQAELEGLRISVGPTNEPGRFSFSIAFGKFGTFHDELYEEIRIKYDPLLMEYLHRQTNYIDSARAELMAKTALQKLGLSEQQIKKLGRPVVNQQEGPQLKQFLPLYHVHYFEKGRSSELDPWDIIYFDIYGNSPGGRITSFGSDYSLPFYEPPRPTNYVEQVTKWLETKPKPRWPGRRR